jgi:hypothetical protein
MNRRLLQFRDQQCGFLAGLEPRLVRRAHGRRDAGRCFALLQIHRPPGAASHLPCRALREIILRFAASCIASATPPANVSSP